MTEQPTPPQAAAMFDQAVCDRLRDAFNEIFLRHPEVKCLSAAVAWNGNLNEADLLHGIWLSPDGPVQTADGIVVSLQQTMRLLTEQFNRATALVTNIQEHVLGLGTEVRNRNEELEALTRQVAAKRAELESLAADRSGDGNPGTAAGPAQNP